VIEVGNAKRAAKNAPKNDVNVAAMIREMEVLRDVVTKAVRLRGIGKAVDKIDDGLNELWRNNPSMSRSATLGVMAHQAFETAMKDFDESIVKAVESGFAWASETPALGPVKTTPDK
jgi:hypothetical protein